MSNSQTLFSETLRSARQAANLTQKEMAEKLAVSRSAYTYYEIGRVQPNLTTLAEICRILNVSSDYLLGLC